MSGGKKMVSSLIMWAFGFVFTIVVQTVLFQPIFQFLIPALARSGVIMTPIFFLLNTLKYFISFFLAALLYTKLVARARFSALWSLLSALGYALVCWLLANYFLPRYIALASNISFYLTCLIVGFGFSVMYVFLSKAALGANAAAAQQAAPVQQTYAPPVQQTYTNPGAQQSYANPGAQQSYTNPGAQQSAAGMDPMSAAILSAIRPSLKAPLTAVLCGREEMTIRESNGVYEIQGYVHSQNGYGAMIATDFKVTARYYNGNWVILSTSVGVQNAKN